MIPESDEWTGKHYVERIDGKLHFDMVTCSMIAKTMYDGGDSDIQVFQIDKLEIYGETIFITKEIRIEGIRSMIWEFGEDSVSEEALDYYNKYKDEVEI